MVYNLGERISGLRKEMNLSQEALAERVGVTRQAISKWERDEATPDIYNLSTLAETFGVSVDDLLSDDIYSVKPNQAKIVAIEMKLRAEKFIMLAVALFIMSSLTFIVVPFSIAGQFMIFGLMLSAGVVLIIKANFMLERFNSLNKGSLNTDNKEVFDEYKSLRKKQRDSFEKVVSVLCTVTYLYLGFFKMLWHPGWLVFLIVPVVTSIYDFIVSRNDIKRL